MQEARQDVINAFDLSNMVHYLILAVPYILAGAGILIVVGIVFSVYHKVTRKLSSPEGQSFWVRDNGSWRKATDKDFVNLWSRDDVEVYNDADKKAFDNGTLNDYGNDSDKYDYRRF